MKMTNKIYCFVCGFVSLLALSVLMSILTAREAQAQDELVAVSSAGTSTAADEAQASREIVAQVTSNVAREELIDLIGDERYQKNKAAAEKKVVAQASRFIPFANPGAIVKQTDGSWKMPVELKISTASLRKLALEAGLMSDSDGIASVLPMIAFTDRSHDVSLRWWMGDTNDDNHKFIASLASAFDEKLQSELSKQGFHYMKPLMAGARSPIPEAFRAEHPSQAELDFASNYFKAPMIARGEVRMRPAKDLPGAAQISIQIQVLQVSTGRTVAEISRQLTTDIGQYENGIRAKLSTEWPDLAKDLSNQIYDSWQKGTMTAHLVKLEIRGALSPQQLGAFKAAVQHNVHEIKDMKDRMFERGSVTLEVDTTGDAAGLAQHLQSPMPAFDVRVASQDANSVTVDVHAK